MKEQHAPFTVKLELTEGCNLGCEFCGVHGIRKDGKAPFYYMTKETADEITKSIADAGWKPRIMLSMHGEPTLNPDFLEIISIIRKNLPRSVIQLFSNAARITGVEDGEMSLRAMIEAGLNSALIDIYKKNDDGYRLRQECLELDFPYQMLGKGVPLYSTNLKKFRLVFSPPINSDAGKIGVVRSLCNHCGAAAPLDTSFNEKKCTRPFREMAFRYNGYVSICCNDYRGEYPIASIEDLSAREIWNHKRFQAARIMLYNNSRDFKPCYGCNAVSVRVGLLPDPKGKESMPNITDKVKLYAQNVSKKNEPLCGENYFIRPWEE